MREKLEQIRALLSEIEIDTQKADVSETVRAFSGLELPDIMRDLVDLLMPFLKPYELALYLFALRYSILESGNQYVRLSSRRLQDGVVRSSHAGTTSRSKDPNSVATAVDTVRVALRGLEKAGALRKEGEPNREGTLYRVLLPEEIPACQAARAEHQQSSSPKPADATQADYYNVRENRLKVWERDAFKCQYCGKQLTRFTSTLDHVRAVANGGDNSFDNLVTACRECNSKKHSRPLGHFMADENPT
jgi:hypothetical protein